MKKTLIALLVLAFSFGVIADHLVGAIITQQQFDNIDFQTRSLEIGIESKEKTQDEIIIVISYSTLQRNNNDWIVKEMQTAFGFPLESYHNCRVEGNTKKECVQAAKNYFKNEVRQFRSALRNDLENQQTKSFIDELTIEDINITSEELNQ